MTLGNRFSLGNYDQCVNIDNNLPEPYGRLEGQYCLAVLPINSIGATLPSRAMSAILDMNRQTDDYDDFSYIRSGICIPKSCSAKDLEENLPFLIRYCKVKGKPALDSLDYVAM